MIHDFHDNDRKKDGFPLPDYNDLQIKAVKPTLRSFVRSRGQNDHHDIIHKSEKNSKSEIHQKYRFWTSKDHIGHKL